jgi:hypothetical protein
MALDIFDIPTLLVIAGIIFLFIAIVRNIRGTFATTIDRKPATILGGLGVILLALGLITAFTGVFQPSETTPTSTPSFNVEYISPSLSTISRQTPTGVEFIRVEQREEGVYITITITKGKEKTTERFFSFPPPTINETWP